MRCTANKHQASSSRRNRQSMNFKICMDLLRNHFSRHTMDAPSSASIFSRTLRYSPNRKILSMLVQYVTLSHYHIATSRRWAHRFFVFFYFYFFIFSTNFIVRHAKTFLPAERRKTCTNWHFGSFVRPFTHTQNRLHFFFVILFRCAERGK